MPRVLLAAAILAFALNHSRWRAILSNGLESCGRACVRSCPGGCEEVGSACTGDRATECEIQRPSGRVSNRTKKAIPRASCARARTGLIMFTA
jgi:hypothetical protein